MVGIVVVSHSRALADAAVALASEMLHGQRVPIEVAAGLDETTFGTDATAIVTAITEADAAADGGVVVLMDLGSAVLSAELALELLDDEVRERVLLCPASLVEGLVVAAVSAAGGASRAEVAAEADGALAGKLAQLGGPAPAPDETGSPGGRPGELVASFTVVNPHGLHARPAAVLAARAREFDAQVELRNRTTGTGWVPAASLSKLGTLGALPGHQLEIRAKGGQAEQALDELLALGLRGFDESPSSVRPAPPAPARPAPPAPDTAPSDTAPSDTAPSDTAPSAAARSAAAGREVTTAPIAASPGLGIGPAYPLRTDAPVPVDEAILEGDPDRAAEWRRLTDAVDNAREDIRRVRSRAAEQVGEAEASIFDAHLAMLDDPELLGGAHTRIDGGAAAATAWAASIAEAHDALAALEDEYLRARAADVRAVGDQVLRALAGGPAEVASPEGVLVAADLTPAQAAELDAARVDAVVLAYGSLTAHATILLRALGIPAVVAAGPAVLAIPEGTLVAVDGIRGEVLVDPDTEVQRALRERAEALADQDREARALTNQPATTLNGVPVSVAANIGSVADALAAAERGADLAGLVRTEFLFLGRDRAPDAAEQEHSYREIAAALHGRRITLRTLDVGGDKPLSYLPTPAEANPFLGLRGIRLALARPELLAEQLLAVVRVAHDTPVDLMFPMVSTLDELLAARQMLAEAIETAGEADPPELRVGIMVEVPATALKAAVFAPHVDFFSIGTNDLTQYTLAAERGNDNVAALGDPLDPGVLRLIDAVCRAAGGGAGPLVAVCGELAADELAVPLLLGLGVRELSVNPRAVPGVKQAVRAVDLPKAVELAARTLRAESATAVRTLLTEFTG